MEQTTVIAVIDVDLDTAAAFDVLVEELIFALAERGLALEPGPSGRVVEGEDEVAHVRAWEPGRRLVLGWHPADWKPEEATEVELSFEPVETGTRVTVEHRGWGGLLGDRGREAMGWFAGEVVAPLFEATAPARFGEWLMDRIARRPSGAQAREGYRDPLFHRPNFGVLLELLALAPDDHLLELGCGGGALLHDALASGCHAIGVDHSPEMVRVSRELNAEAIAAGRLEVVEANVNDPLPFPDETFTCGTMTNVLGFLPEPIAMLGADPAWRGTPAAPEPFASRIRFYTDEELAQLGRDAGSSTCASSGSTSSPTRARPASLRSTSRCSPTPRPSSSPRRADAAIPGVAVVLTGEHMFV